MNDSVFLNLDLLFCTNSRTILSSIEQICVEYLLFVGVLWEYNGKKNIISDIIKLANEGERQ